MVSLKMIIHNYYSWYWVSGTPKNYQQFSRFNLLQMHIPFRLCLFHIALERKNKMQKRNMHKNNKKVIKINICRNERQCTCYQPKYITKWYSAIFRNIFTYLMEKKYSGESNQVYKSCNLTDLLTSPLY